MRRRLKRFGAIVRKEITQLVRDRTTLSIVLIIPFLELFLFGYAVDLTVDHIPTAVADLSLDAQSRALINALEASGYFDVATYLQDEAAVIRAVDEGRVRAGVVIPPDFATQVERGRAQALILLDGSDSFTVQSGYGAATAIAQDRAMKLMVEKVGQVGGRLGRLPITSSVQILYNSNMDDMVFIVPAMAGMLMQLLAVNLTAMAVVRERELGTIEQLLVTPVRPIELMVGKMVPNVFVTAFDMLSVTLLGIFWFGVPFQGDPWLFAWLSLLFLVSGLGLGLLVSTMAQTQKQAQQITTLLMLLSMLLTGFLYPRAPMPPIIRAIGNFIPLTYFVRIVRGVFTKGIGLSFIWSDVAALIVYGGVVMVIAAATFRKRLD
ncbi:MAG: ABC transporter permease [Anaerolineae bacterium]|nr:MAG: ABC transporter permease [Anaerolineae bacterium]